MELMTIWLFPKLPKLPESGWTPVLSKAWLGSLTYVLLVAASLVPCRLSNRSTRMLSDSDLGNLSHRCHVADCPAALPTLKLPQNQKRIAQSRA